MTAHLDPETAQLIDHFVDELVSRKKRTHDRGPVTAKVARLLIAHPWLLKPGNSKTVCKNVEGRRADILFALKAIQNAELPANLVPASGTRPVDAEAKSDGVSP